MYSFLLLDVKQLSINLVAPSTIFVAKLYYTFDVTTTNCLSVVRISLLKLDPFFSENSSVHNNLKK